MTTFQNYNCTRTFKTWIYIFFKYEILWTFPISCKSHQILRSNYAFYIRYLIACYLENNKNIIKLTNQNAHVQNIQRTYWSRYLEHGSFECPFDPTVYQTDNMHMLFQHVQIRTCQSQGKEVIFYKIHVSYCNTCSFFQSNVYLVCNWIHTRFSIYRPIKS